MSAAFDGKQVTHLSLLSEKGKTVRMVKPWPSKTVKVVRSRDARPITLRQEDGILVFDTQPGERYEIGSA